MYVFCYVFISLYIIAEVVAGVMIYRKRDKFLPALRQAVGRYIGTSDIGKKLQRIESKLNK